MLTYEIISEFDVPIIFVRRVCVGILFRCIVHDDDRAWDDGPVTDGIVRLHALYIGFQSIWILPEWIRKRPELLEWLISWQRSHPTAGFNFRYVLWFTYMKFHL